MVGGQVDSERYNAVVNHEEQYSVWQAYRELPAGWRLAGKEGTKQECLDWIQTVWTDMRPLSLRQSLDEPARADEALELEEAFATGPSLLERLSVEDRRLIASRTQSSAELKKQIEDGYVLLKFTETQGGTELGVTLIKDRCVFGNADFANGQGSVRLEGALVLDYVRVELIAELELASLQGWGRLRRTEAPQ